MMKREEAPREEWRERIGRESKRREEQKGE